MINQSKRPEHLPDFVKPPLNEVVLGVQFAPPQGYHQLLAYKVWELFKTDYPLLQELPAIPPAFETFGLPQPGSIGHNFNFGIVTGAVHDRFWFLRESQDELIQFQNDRLLHNWRKVGDQTNEYPRFEKMIASFESELLRLQAFAESLVPQTLAINQCEVSYINQISDASASSTKSADWLKFLSLDDKVVEDFSGSFREIIRSSEGKPLGRLTCDASSEFDALGHKIIALNLTVRGTPSSPNIASALEFLKKGREHIVSKFAELTTESAHAKWGRRK